MKTFLIKFGMLMAILMAISYTLLMWFLAYWVSL